MPNLENLQQKFVDLKDDLKDIPSNKHADAKDAVGQFLVDAILTRVARAETPVEGALYKKTLSPEYAKIKKELGGIDIPNLELEGDLLQSLGFNKRKDGIAVGIIDPDQRPKADGHNHLTPDSVRSNNPERRFIPANDQNFLPEIQDEISRILDEFKTGPPEITDRQGIEGEPLSVTLSNIISDDVLLRALLRRING